MYFMLNSCINSPVSNVYNTGFEIVPIRVSETCQNLSGHVKCQGMLIRWTCPFFATCKVLLELQEETPQADIDQDNVSLAGVLQGAVGRAVDNPVFALLLDDNTRFSHDRRRGRGMQSGRVWTPFSQSFSVSCTQILQQLK